jgi:hypothetical protein
MLYEPYRKRSYRFPSAKSITEIDARLYFPEKHPFADESISFENGDDSRDEHHLPAKESFKDI